MYVLTLHYEGANNSHSFSLQSDAELLEFMNNLEMQDVHKIVILNVSN